MNVTSARFTQDGSIEAVMDGRTLRIPDNMANRHRQAVALWQAGGGTIAPYVPSPTAGDVRREASRRMQVLLDARDAAHLDILIYNGTREAVRLLNAGEQNWTAAEATRAVELQQADADIEAIRAASNSMETDPPADYLDDSHWP